MEFPRNARKQEGWGYKKLEGMGNWDSHTGGSWDRHKWVESTASLKEAFRLPCKQGGAGLLEAL